MIFLNNTDWVCNIVTNYLGSVYNKKVCCNSLLYNNKQNYFSTEKFLLKSNTFLLSVIMTIALKPVKFEIG